MARSCKDCIKVGVCEIYDIVQYNGHAIGCGSFIDTADVVPKSEIEKIFEEIENEINNELQNNHKVLPQVEFSNEIWNRISGRINALQGIRDFIAELKKKYTEDQK